MDFKGYLAKGWEITKLNRDAAEQVARDGAAFGPAVLFFAIGGLAGGLGGALFSGGFTLVAAPIFAVVWSFIWVGILYLLARIMGGRAEFTPYYSALGIGSIVHWAGIIPFLGALVALWYIPVAVVVTERVHGISTARAIAVVLIPIVAAIILVVFMIAVMGMAAFMALMHSGGM